MVEAERNLPRLAIDPKERADRDGRSLREGSAAPEGEGVGPAANNSTQMVAVGVVARPGISRIVGGGAADVELDHAVLLEVEQPDVQAQFGREAGKWSPHATISGGGRGLHTTGIHVVEEHIVWGCGAVFHCLAGMVWGIRVVHDQIGCREWQSGNAGKNEAGTSFSCILLHVLLDAGG